MQGHLNYFVMLTFFIVVFGDTTTFFFALFVCLIIFVGWTDVKWRYG